MKKIALVVLNICCVIILHAQYSKTVDIVASGGLSVALTTEEKNSITELILTGTIDARDFVTMRDSMPLLAELDLIGVTIAAYSGTDGTSPPGLGSQNYPADAISQYAFMNSNWEGKISLISVVLPTSITDFGKYAFYNCTGLTSVSIPPSVRTIGFGAFQNCTGLSSINIPEGVVTIKGSAFYSCSSLTSVLIPSTVTKIEDAAFSNIATSLIVHEDNLFYSSSDDVLFDKLQTAILQCTKLKTGIYSIPLLIKDIGNYAFEGCGNLSSVLLPEGLLNIGEQAFRWCGGLTSITIPSSIKTIKNYAFAYCYSLDSIFANSGFPVDLSKRWGVFQNIDKTSCTLYVPFRTAGRYAAANQWQDFENIVEATNGFLLFSNSLSFSEAGGSDTISISANVDWDVISDQPWLTVLPGTGSGNNILTFTAEANKLSVARKAIVTVSSIGIPSQTISITQEAEPKTLELTAGSLAALLSAEEKNNITNLILTGTIDARDFVVMRDSMPLLSKLNLSGVTIAEYAGVHGTYPSYWGSQNYPADAIPQLAFYDENTSKGKASLRIIILPVSIRAVNEYAFSQCTGLANIDIPLNVIVLENDAFANCTNLNSINLPASLSIIGYAAFQNCSGLSTFTIPEGVDTIRGYAFGSCTGLTSIAIPSTVNSIEESAFINFSGSITVDDENMNYSDSEGVLFNKDKTRLLQCPVSKTGSYILPALVDTISNLAFWDCRNLTSIILQEGVMHIGYQAFWGCSAKNSITIPSSIITIQDYAFGYCDGLDTIYSNSVFPVDLSSSPNVFYRVNKNSCILSVPYGTAGRYAAANQWKDFENIVEDTNGFLLYSNNLILTEAGGSDTISIASNVEWSAISDQPWLDVSPGTGTGNDTLTFTAEANTETITRTATVTISSPGLIDQFITITQAALIIPKDVNINYSAVLPVIDGVEDAIWDEVTPIPIEKYFQVETPTVTAYWKALWANEGIYVMLNVQDDNHWPGWESGRSYWEFDNSEIYFDVNDTLTDGLGPRVSGSGHYQAFTRFVPELYGVTIENEPPTTQYTGGTYAYSLSGENYSIERFIPFKNFIDKNGKTLNRSTFLEKGKIGFDIYVVDQDEGITTSRQRKVWQNEAVYDESWNNMDDCGTVTLAGINLLQSDSLALIAFYNATTGSGWYRKSNWLTGPVSTWYGVTVEGNRVTRLILRGNNLSGHLPVEIGDLTALINLNTSSNKKLIGNIPDEIGNLQKLESFLIPSNNFSGTIPSGIWNLTNLDTLDLNNNSGLDGTIPSEIENLVNLKYLNFYRIGFTGSIPPELLNLTNLEELILYGNDFDLAPMPDFSSLSNLKYLNVADCNFTESIPVSLLQMDKLRILDISNNPFAPAPIPDFSLLVNLYNLIAKGCNFVGSIPVSSLNIPSLNWLYLENNHLSGSIPSDIGNLSNIVDLNLSSNELSGSIPNEIGNLSSLQYLYLNNNQLTGSIPASIGNLSSLLNLDLCNNQISGSIPSELGNLSMLSYLGLNFNNLSGELPSELENLSNLTVCGLMFNKLSGDLPKSFSSIIGRSQVYSQNETDTKTFEDFIKYRNELIDQLNSESVGNTPENLLGSIFSLWVQNNKFTFANLAASGLTPSSIGSFNYAPQDTTLGLDFIAAENAITVVDGKAEATNYQWYLNYQVISGATNDTLKITDEIGKYHCVVTNTIFSNLTLTSQLFDLGVSDSLALVALFNATNGDGWTNNTNWLTGRLETWYGVTISGGRVTRLNLQNNHLWGHLPVEIGNLTALTSLNISSNYQITGSIPDEIGNLSELTVLNLFNNGHSGNLPSSIWNLTKLTTLNLGACWSLEGPFPTEIGNLTNLEVLNLYGIGLTGSLPSNIGDLSSLRVMQLEYNNLTGLIPAEIGNLNSLEYCSLNSNQLTGSIPDEIGNLSSLEYCYFYNNQLTGSIPASIGNLSKLNILQLNNNSLSGNIPTEFGNLSNLQYCHLENNQLAGDLPALFSTILKTKAAPPSQKTGSINDYISNGYINIPTIGSDGLPVDDAPANLLTNLYRLQVQNNRFTFANLEASGIIPGSIDDFKYSPQDTILGLTFIPDHSLTVIDGKAGNSIYQWYYCSKLIAGETNDTLVDINPTGDYYCKVTNTTFPALQLTSEVYGIPGQGFILSRDTVTIAATEGSTVSLSISSQIEWTATPNETWLSVDPDSRPGSGSITITGSENIGEKRTGTITVSSPGYHDLTLTVIQLSALEVDPVAISISELEGSTATLNVTASVDWTVSSDQLWLTVAPESGSGNGTITLTAAKNKGPIRLATVTLSSPGFNDRVISVTQATYANIYVLFTPTSPVIDGVEEATWNTIAPIPISKNFQTETPTVTAYWKAMWTDSGLYVLMNVHDNDHYPSWKTGGPTYQYDKTDLYFDVNETLIDGKGPAAAGTGHFQSAPGFTESGYDIPVIGSPTDARTPGGDYAYHLDGENYVYEQFFPFGNFYTEENVQMDKDAFTSRPIGFDVTITDQDEGITTSRQRMVWMQDGIGDVLDESWNNMDDVGTIRLVEEVFNVAPVANAGKDQWVNETVKVLLTGFASSDADGDELSYLWTAPAGITLSSNTASQPTFTAPSVLSPATYCFTLVVNDGIVNSRADTVIVHVMDAVPPSHFETVWNGDAVDQMNINVVSVNIDSIEIDSGDEIGVFDGDLCVGVGVYPGVTRKSNIAWLGSNMRYDSLYFVELTKAGYNVVDKSVIKGDLTIEQIADLDTFDLVILSRSMISSEYNYPEKYDAIQAPLLCMSNIAARYYRLRFFPQPNIDDASIQDVMSAIDLNHPIFNNLTLSGSNTIDIANPGNYLKPLMDQKSAGNGNLIGVTSIDSLVLVAEWNAKQPYYEGSVDTLHGKRMVYFNTLGSNPPGLSESYLSNNGYQLLKNIAEYMITGSVDTPDIIPIVVSADDGSGNGYTPGHILSFKLYDSSRDIEIDNVVALYLDDDPSWSTDGKFSAGSTSFVELTGSVVPQNLTVTNTTLADGVIDCFDAHDTIIVAGGGNSVVLENNSTATFIAGQSVRFQPGFHAESGSNMDAYITTTGSFCDLIEPGIVEVIALEKSTPEGDLPKQSFVEGKRVLRVYPNPNNGCFKIELTNFENKASVCIYNSLGIRVYRSEAGGLPIREINLPAISKGIYFVRVTDGKEQFTKKMVLK